MPDKHLSLDLVDRAWKDPGMGALICLGVALLSLAILLIWGFKPDLIAGWPELPSYAVVGLLGSTIAGSFFWYRHRQSLSPKPQVDPPVEAPRFTREESRLKPSGDIVGATTPRSIVENPAPNNPAEVPVRDNARPVMSATQRGLLDDLVNLGREANTRMKVQYIPRQPEPTIPQIDPRNIARPRDPLLELQVEQLKGRIKAGAVSETGRSYLLHLAQLGQDELFGDRRDPILAELVHMDFVVRDDSRHHDTKQRYVLTGAAKCLIQDLGWRTSGDGKGPAPWTKFKPDPIY